MTDSVRKPRSPFLGAGVVVAMLLGAPLAAESGLAREGVAVPASEIAWWDDVEGARSWAAALLERTGPSTLHDAVALALEVQGVSHLPEVNRDDSRGDLGRSLDALLLRHGLAPSAIDAATREVLNLHADDEVLIALATLVDTFLEYHGAALRLIERQEASWLPAVAASFRWDPAISPADLSMGALTPTWQPSMPDFTDVEAARSGLLVATVAFAEAWSAQPRPDSQSGEADLHGPGTIAQLRIPPVVAFDLDGIDTSYTEDFALIVDVGGHDTYANNAGGGRRLLLDPGWDCPTSATPLPGGGATDLAAAAVVDLDGDDNYGLGRSCGVNGGAAGGMGFLLDAAGNDRYLAGENGVNGGGWFGGAGFLLDVAGDDTYLGKGRGVNGGAVLAADAVLIDIAGNDRYTGDGSFPYAVGGVNGASAGQSSGFLLDIDGDDAYLGGVNSNGAATATSVARLIDLDGDDHYISLHPTSSSVNGAAYPSSICVWWTPLVCVPLGTGSALLLDLRGRDTYRNQGQDCQDCTQVPKGLMGAQVDVPGA